MTSSDSGGHRDASLKRSPLHGRHAALGARFAEFGGWEMPLQYSGVLTEHTAVRTAVGLFDVSHLGKVSVRGPGAAEYVNACLTNDLRRIAPGQAQYTLCCDVSGGVVDDLIAYLDNDEHVFLVPNAANSASVVERLASAAPAGITVTNQHTDFAVLAVQGPASAALLEAVGLPADHPYMGYVQASFHGAPVIVCRTGYTGEHGYELLPRWADAGLLWDALLAAGGPLGVRPAGLAARDTLRTEMGYPLHGQDLSMEISPVQARSGWAVGWNKPAFWGREALLAEKQAGPSRRLSGLESLDRGIPRPGMSVLGPTGETVGIVTSGTFSPTRKVGIGLALLATVAALSSGDVVEIDVRGRRSRALVVDPPFVPSSVR